VQRFYFTIHTIEIKPTAATSAVFVVQQDPLEPYCPFTE